MGLPAPRFLGLLGLLAGPRAAQALDVAGAWTGVEGGANRVCRGASPTDDSESYYTVRDGVANLDLCKELCQKEAVCSGVEFWEQQGRCELWTATISASEESPGFQCWRFAKATKPAPTPAPTPTPAPIQGVIEQKGAKIPAGGSASLYAIGSSNIPWNTWLDQLHMTLKHLGYATPVIAGKHPDTIYHPTTVPICEDVDGYRELETARIGKIGWASWGFAFEDEDDCDEAGFRPILGHKVGCTNAWACNPKWIGSGEPLIRPSEIAEDARHSSVTVLSNWINDSKQRHAKNVCYDGESIDPVATTEITLFTLKKVISAIHARNPDVVVAVLALYPDALISTGVIVERTLPLVAAINAAVEAGLRDVPNTVWVNYTFPTGEPMFQPAGGHTGHPNCRGDKVIAQSIVDALFRAKVLSRGLLLSSEEKCLAATECRGLDVGCCQGAALCRWLSSESACVSYEPGIMESGW